MSSNNERSVSSTGSMATQFNNKYTYSTMLKVGRYASVVAVVLKAFCACCFVVLYQEPINNKLSAVLRSEKPKITQNSRVVYLCHKPDFGFYYYYLCYTIGHLHIISEI